MTNEEKALALLDVAESMHASAAEGLKEVDDLLARAKKNSRLVTRLYVWSLVNIAVMLVVSGSYLYRHATLECSTCAAAAEEASDAE